MNSDTYKGNKVHKALESRPKVPALVLHFSILVHNLCIVLKKGKLHPLKPTFTNAFLLFY